MIRDSSLKGHSRTSYASRISLLLHESEAKQRMSVNNNDILRV